MNAALLQILVSKGILSRSQANALGAANGAARTQQLLLLLKQEGLLSDSDMAALQAGLPERPSDHMLADIKYSDNLVTAQVRSSRWTDKAEGTSGSSAGDSGYRSGACVTDRSPRQIQIHQGHNGI